MRILGFCLLLVCAARVAATTVIPPDFDLLVQRSELVFRGRVIDLKSGWSGEGARRRIATWVTFAIERTLRGEATETITLEFAGGTVGERRAELTGGPRFEVGDHGVFFVENRKARLCPLVALRHGRYRIAAGGPAGDERVLRDDGTPLRAVGDVTIELREPGEPARVAAAGAGLPLVDFETAIVARSAVLPRIEKAPR